MAEHTVQSTEPPQARVTADAARKTHPGAAAATMPATGSSPRPTTESPLRDNTIHKRSMGRGQHDVLAANAVDTLLQPVTCHLRPAPFHRHTTHWLSCRPPLPSLMTLTLQIETATSSRTSVGNTQADEYRAHPSPFPDWTW